MCTPEDKQGELNERPAAIVDGDRMSDDALIGLLPADKVIDLRGK
jgi:hypothetical protein